MTDTELESRKNMWIKVSNKHYCYYIFTDMSKQEFEANKKHENCRTISKERRITAWRKQNKQLTQNWQK